MKKDFDFDDIGKRTPYRTPANFYEEMQKKVMQRAGIKQHRKQHLKLIVSGVVATAALLAGFIFFPHLQQPDDNMPSSNKLAIENIQASLAPEDSWIRNLSDEELEELVSFSENDPFLN